MRTKNFLICPGITLVLLLAALFPYGNAQVNANAGIGGPPPYVIHAPPPVVVIQRSYVYYVPGIQEEILFYHGQWYRPFGGRWYRSRSYNGPWRYLAPSKVPYALTSLPPGYRTMPPPGHHKIPYGQLKKNWSYWERDKYWHKDPEWRGERSMGPPGKDDPGPRKDYYGGPPGHGGAGPGKGHGGPPGKP